MCHIDGRSDTEAEAIIAIVEGAVEARMRAKEPFTALDISNALKGQNYPVRHREVSTVVRDIYDSGAMAHYEYERKMIDVRTDGGQKRAQAWLYLHDEHKDRDYSTTLRAQDALPPVTDAQARNLDDVAPAGNPLSPLVAQGQVNAYVANRNRIAVQMARGLKVPTRGGSLKACRSASRATRSRAASRRDGALAIPRRLVEQAGWQVGDHLTLAFDATSAKLVLTADASAAATVTATVRVWADLRVRVAKTKVRRCAAPIAANFSVAANRPSFAVDADGTLQIEP